MCRRPRRPGPQQTDRCRASATRLPPGLVELDYVGASPQPEPQRANAEATHDDHVAPPFSPGPRFVDSLVHVGPIEGQRVIRPQPLNMDHGALPLAKAEVL